jgi:hypothetical protein
LQLFIHILSIKSNHYVVHEIQQRCPKFSTPTVNAFSKRGRQMQRANLHLLEPGIFASPALPCPTLPCPSPPIAQSRLPSVFLKVGEDFSPSDIKKAIKIFIKRKGKGKVGISRQNKESLLVKARRYWELARNTLTRPQSLKGGFGPFSHLF